MTGKARYSRWPLLAIFVFCAGSLAQTPEDSGAACPLTPPASFSELPHIDALPTPFVYRDGRAVTSRADWSCRRREISAQLQHWIYGDKPPPGAEVNGHLEKDALTVKVADNGQSVSFTAKILWPTTGKPPYPAMIGIGRSFLDNQALLDQGVAIIEFPNNDIGDQSGAAARGQGKFYELYGKDHSAASTVAWAWGVSRLIDALGAITDSPIDANRLGVTGCSRNGKGALVIGALDERIALSIIQESGSGGSASWRVSEAMKEAGANVQTASQIVTENTWLTQAFARFAQQVDKLPVDNHQLLGLVVPRGLLLLENTDMEWLGNKSAYLSALAAREIYAALGAEQHIGITQVGGHQHCVVPDSQKAAIHAFVERFLLGQSVNTRVWSTDADYTLDLKRWIPWTTPNLAP